jgi:hypothetical protein
VEKDREELQEALDQLCIWAEKWGMVFNVGKCKVMIWATTTSVVEPEPEP